MLRDNAVYILSRAVPSAVGFVTSMALTRLLTPFEYDTYGLGLGMVTLLAAIFFDWHALSFMRFYQANAQNPVFMPTVALSFLLLCAASGVLAIAVEVSGLLPGEYRALLWISLPGCWAFAWFELTARVQVARFRPMRYFWMNLLRNVLILVFTITAAWQLHDPLAALGAGYLAMLCAALAFHPSGIRFAPRLFEIPLAKRLIAFGWAMAIVSTLGGISFALDRGLLKALAEPGAVGYYTVAFALAQTTIMTIGGGIGSATYSLAVRAVEVGDRAAIRTQLMQNCGMLLALLLPASIGVAMVAPALAKLCVGPAYVEPVALLIPWMAGAAFFYSFRANYIDHAFQLGHSTNRLAIVVAVSVAVNLTLDVLLIPHFGYVGAAVASLVASVVGLAHGIIASRGVMAMPVPANDALKIAAASLGMCLFLLPLHGETEILELIFQVGGGVAVYAILILATDALGLRGTALARLGRVRPSA